MGPPNLPTDDRHGCISDAASRLKVAVIDVVSGRWDVFAPAEFDDDALSASLIRASSDQAQVALLKERACKAAA